MEQTKLNLIIKAIEEKKCEDIVTIDTNERSPFFSYVVIATCNNSRKASATADEIQKNLALINENVKHIEGVSTDSEWVLIDCYDIIVHLFTENERNRVDLESLLQKNYRK